LAGRSIGFILSPFHCLQSRTIAKRRKALDFLRSIKERVFLGKKNITRWEHLEQAALQSGLDARKLKTDFEGQAKALFEEDLTMAGALGVPGFRTIFLNSVNSV
jgi:predicted DsbA family dithiol-disulfide isomerase